MDETLFIANFDEADAEARSAFQAVASNYDQEFTFGIRGASGGHTHDPQDPVVKCYRPLEGETRTFQGPFDRNSLESFVKEASVGQQPNKAVHTYSTCPASDHW